MKKLLLVILCVVFVSETRAQIYHFQSDLLKEWPEGGPELLLEFEGIGVGWPSVISNGKYIYTSGKIDSMDHLTCIDFNGDEKWQVA